MPPLDQAFISGTTLAQFVSAAYSCTEGSKFVFDLYGQRQSTHELTDRPESSEKFAVVVIGAVPHNSDSIPSHLTRIGFLTICQAPVHKLSYKDVQRMQEHPAHKPQSPQILFHFTKEIGSDGIVRVLYTMYEFSGEGVDAPRTLRVSIDNLVDSLEGFTKISSICARNTFTTPAGEQARAPSSHKEPEYGEQALKHVDTLAREKAQPVKEIVDLSKQLASRQSSP